MKHTQGNWEVGTNTNSSEWMKIYCNGKAIGRALQLSKVGNRKATDFEEEQANAKVMAASKDLLEALLLAEKILVCYIPNSINDGSVNGQSLYKIKEAIEKATN